MFALFQLLIPRGHHARPADLGQALDVHLAVFDWIGCGLSAAQIRAEVDNALTADAICRAQAKLPLAL
jgi:hypothetical protein